MKIPFVDFAQAWKSESRLGQTALKRFFSSGRYILGDETARFERDMARKLRIPYFVGVANGTDAITLSLMALGIGKGDEVIVPAFTAYPTVVGIRRSGARPILSDVRLSDGLLDPTRLERSITKRTKAIVPVHLYGRMCDMSAINRISRQKGLLVVEDCAQAFGADSHRRMPGTFGECGAFSFYPTKTLGGYGDGGGVATSSKKIYDLLRAMRNYGQRIDAEGNSHFISQGMNSRLDEIQAALLRSKLPFIDRANKRRIELAKRYRNGIRSKVIMGTPDQPCVYNLFVVRVKNREHVRAAMAQRGVGTMMHYNYVGDLKEAGHFPAARALSQEVLSLPMHPFLKDKEIDFIIRVFNKAVEVCDGAI